MKSMIQTPEPSPSSKMEADAVSSRHGMSSIGLCLTGGHPFYHHISEYI
jgi:hypothetical protein